MILQGELGSVPFLPKAKERFPAKGLECLHVLVKPGAQGHRVKKSVIPFRPACSTSVGKLPLCSETSGFSLYTAGKITACHCRGGGGGGGGQGGWPRLREKLIEPQRWSLSGREWHFGGTWGGGGGAWSSRAPPQPGTLNKKHMI